VVIAHNHETIAIRQGFLNYLTFSSHQEIEWQTFDTEVWKYLIVWRKEKGIIAIRDRS